MSRIIPFTGLFIIYCFVVNTSTVLAVDHLAVEGSGDTTYLPYSLDTTWSTAGSPFAKPIMHSLFVLRPMRPGDSTAELARAYNSTIFADEPSVTSQRIFPSLTVEDDDPIWLTFSDVATYDDPGQDIRQLVGTGYRNDSAWFFQLIPDSDGYVRCFLATGRDSTGDGRWEPGLPILLIEDYDYDGHTEAFVYVNSGRDYLPRLLICVDIDEMRIEWSVDMPGNLDRHRFYSLEDSLSPGVIFTAYNPKQGVTLGKFSDLYAYLFVMDGKGNITNNYMVARSHYYARMRPAPEPGQYYLSHRLPITDTSESDKEDAEGYYLSIVDRHGSVLKTIAGEGPVRDMWMGPYPKTGQAALYVSPFNGRMLVYSPDLQLLAASDTITGPVFVTWLRITGRSDSVIAFSDGIYDQNLHKQLHFSGPASSVEAVKLDSVGRAITIAVGSGSGGMVGDIHSQDIFKFVSIFYVHHQSYILSGLLGLFLVLIVVNYYRQRTKQNLVTITRQKKELETAHQALRDAQAKLVEQEKYKQARDIAGGFAHEIRNALFPAEAALIRLKQMPNGGNANSQKTDKYVGSANRAVERAIGITEIISRYTRLGSESQPANVGLKSVIDEVLAANADRIDDQGVAVEVKGETDVSVTANHDQMVMALNNLVRNSLDALAETSDPHVCLLVETKKNTVALSVTDNGAGIPDDIKERVFDAFFSTKPDTGTGLGLSVVARILDMYDGTLAMKSAPGEGTTFTMRLKQADRVAPS